MKSDYIWMDGEMVPYEDAGVPFLTPTLHYGPGVFEGIRCYETSKGPAVFRLREHLERFIDSIQILGIKGFSYTVEQLRQAVHETIQTNGYSECYIRPLMYLEGPLGLNIDASVPSGWHCRLGVGSIPGGRGARKGCDDDDRIIHSSTSKRKHDQG